MVSRSIVFAAALLTGAACSPPTEPRQVEDSVWFEPAAPEPGGCERFTKRSERFPVDMAIYFRAPGGGFTMDRNSSVCANMPGSTWGE